MSKFEELSIPLQKWSYRWIYWNAISSAVKAVAPFSDSLTIGYKYGFDSGSMLDYVYKNKANGRFIVGKIIDYVHLNAIGWRGIRQRKIHLKSFLRRAIEDLDGRKKPIYIADVASGPGRYLLETLEELGKPQTIQATMRDMDQAGLEEGRFLAKNSGLCEVRYEIGHAFDSQDLQSIKPAPHIVIVSGLYELFSDNSLITRSLAAIHSILEKDGRFIYTNQPIHPQLELIARCLPNREGKPWVMRLRSQEEMDRLVREAGFRKLETVTDRWGIFTVSSAVKD